MATATPGSIQRKRKLATYGKKHSPATFNSDLDFFAEENGSYALPRSVKQQKDHEKVQSPRMDSPVVQAVAKRVPERLTLTKKDTFDFPSSEDESAEEVAEKPVRKATAKRPLVDDREKPVKKPAWSDKRPRLDSSLRKSVSFADVEDAPVQISLPVHSKVSANRSTSLPPVRAAGNMVDPAALQGMSASERLRYRRGLPATQNNDTQAPTKSQTSIRSAKKGLTEALSTTTRPNKKPESDILVSGTEPVHDVDTTTTATQLGTPRKLNETLDSMIEFLDDSQMGSGSQRHATLPPRSTPPKTTPHTGGLTPKQNRLWQDLFAEIEDSSEGNSKSGKPKPRQHTELKTSSRLVDRLRAAVQPKEPGSSDEEDTDVEMSIDVDEKPTDVPTAQADIRRTASRPVASRLTYTQQRSHLAEDSLEDAMMLNYAPATTVTAHNRSTATSQNGFGFDLEDDEPETTGGRIRSVHELRAQGKTTRITAEIDDLSKDAQNATNTKRRTLAVVKLVDRLCDVDFAKAFVQGGHDSSLMTMLPPGTDWFSNAVMVIASIILLSDDLATPSLQSIKESLLRATDLLGSEIDATDAKQMRVSGKEIFTSFSCLLRRVLASGKVSSGGQQHILLRTLYLQAVDLLVRKLRRNGDAAALFEDDDLAKLCPLGAFAGKATQDTTLVISILESLSLTSPSWPSSVIETIATLPAAMNKSNSYTEHTKFLAYRLCLNVTNDRTIDHFFFTRGGGLQYLLREVIDGFSHLVKVKKDDAEERKLKLDLLILAIGILINLSEYSKAARQTILEEPSKSMLSELVQTFQKGHNQTKEAESEDESSGNVAYGYLSIMLANFCQEDKVRDFIQNSFKDNKLDALVLAVDEFVQHHQSVDRTNFEGVEGQQIWSAFTERLKHVLVRLRKNT